MPKAVAFLVILIVGWIIAKVLRKVISKLLARVGLDRVAERGGLRKYTGKYTVSELSGLLVYFAVLLFTLQFAFNVFGPNPVSDLLNALVAWLPHLFIAGVIMVVAFAVGNTVFELISGAMSNTSYGRPMARVAQVLIIAVAAIAAFEPDRHRHDRDHTDPDRGVGDDGGCCGCRCRRRHDRTDAVPLGADAGGSRKRRGPVVGLAWRPTAELSIRSTGLPVAVHADRSVSADGDAAGRDRAVGASRPMHPRRSRLMALRRDTPVRCRRSR